MPTSDWTDSENPTMSSTGVERLYSIAVASSPAPLSPGADGAGNAVQTFPVALSNARTCPSLPESTIPSALNTPAHDHFYIRAAQAPRRAAAVHRGVAAAQHNHALANAGDEIGRASRRERE